MSTIQETSRNPESTNSSRITFAGTGDGHFTFPLPFTTINIGSYVMPCFNDFCRKEITIAFWFRLFGYSNHPKNGSIFEFLTFDRNLNNEVKVWLMFIDGKKQKLFTFLFKEYIKQKLFTYLQLFVYILLTIVFIYVVNNCFYICYVDLVVLLSL